MSKKTNELLVRIIDRVNELAEQANLHAAFTHVPSVTDDVYVLIRLVPVKEEDVLYGDDLTELLKMDRETIQQLRARVAELEDSYPRGGREDFDD